MHRATTPLADCRVIRQFLTSPDFQDLRLAPGSRLEAVNVEAAAEHEHAATVGDPRVNDTVILESRQLDWFASIIPDGPQVGRSAFTGNIVETTAVRMPEWRTHLGFLSKFERESAVTGIVHPDMGCARAFVTFA